MPEADRPHLAEAVVEQDNDALLIVELDARSRPVIVFCNPALIRLRGLPSQQIEGQSLAVLRAGSTDPLAFAQLVRAVAEGTQLELELELETGQGARQVRVQGRPLGGGRSGYLIRILAASMAAPASGSEAELTRRASLTAELASDAVYHLRVEPDLRLVLDWTAGAFTRLTGYRPDELEAQGGWSVLVDPADLRLVQRRAQRLLAGEDASVEYRVRSRSGHRIWLRDRGRPEWDDRHEVVVGATCAAQDITEQRRFEQRVLAQQQDRRALIGLSDGLVLVVDADERLRDVGGEVPGELGRRLRAAIGRPLEDVLGEEPIRLWREHAGDVVPGWPVVRFAFQIRPRPVRSTIRRVWRRRPVARFSPCSDRAPPNSGWCRRWPRAATATRV